MAGGGTVAFACDGVIKLTQTLQVSNSVVLDGTGHDITLSGSNSVRIFHLNNLAQLTLKGLTLADGLALGTNGAPGLPGGSGTGGAVYNSGGILRAIDCAFLRNKALGGQGGMGYLTNGLPGVLPGVGGDGAGGAIFNLQGATFLTNVLFIENRAVCGPGGDIPNGRSGSSGSAYGGAIHCFGGNVTVHRGQFTDNGTAFGEPGSIEPSGNDRRRRGLQLRRRSDRDCNLVPGQRLWRRRRHGIEGLWVAGLRVGPFSIRVGGWPCWIRCS